MPDDLPPQNAEEYIGDGVYVSFDGWYIRLRADASTGHSHLIYLEQENYRSLLRWIKRYSKLAEHFND